jgi:hypothetical protein
MTEQGRDDRVVDAGVDAAWRQAAQEQPPPAVDAAILAAARTAVGRDATQRPSAPPRRRWTNWQPLAAAAGVIGLSFLLVQMLPRDPLGRPRESQDAPRAPAAKSAAESAATTATPVPSTDDARRVRAEEPSSSPAALPPTPVLRSAPPPPSQAAAAVNDAASVASEERAATAGAAPPAAMEAAAARQTVAPGPDSPAAWANRIAVLHEAGDLAAAEAELRAFRAAHPDADDYLPEAVHAWAASVGRDGNR